MVKRRAEAIARSLSCVNPSFTQRVSVGWEKMQEAEQKVP